MSGAVERFVELATTALREYVDTGMGNVVLLRAAAEQLVNLRQMHRAPANPSQPDWQGRSRAYRDVVAAINKASGVPEERRRALVNRMAYHVGVELRKRLTPDELDAAGIPVTSYYRERYKARLQRAVAADPVERVLEVGRLVDELYKPEGRAVWWRNFALRDDEGRRRMLRGLIGMADGVFV